MNHGASNIVNCEQYNLTKISCGVQKQFRLEPREPGNRNMLLQCQAELQQGPVTECGQEVPSTFFG